MIILRNFSELSDRNMIEKIIDRLDRERIEDYEVVSSIPKDVISIAGNPSALKVYIPYSLEYSQYDIDDFIRSIKPHFRTNTILERDIFVMKMSGSFSIDQTFRLIQYIISLEGFCALIE